MKTGRERGAGIKARSRAGAAAGLFLAFLALAGSCSPDDGKKGDAGSGPAPVLVAEVLRKDVPVTLTAIGSVEAINSVAVKSQVAGIIKTVHFEEGRHLEARARLFIIDPEPFRIAVDQAQAQLDRDTAQADLARRVAERSQVLRREDALSKEDYERDRFGAAALAAAVRSDRAALERAQLELSYCDVAAPIAGVAGRLQVTKGNLVLPQAVTLVTINQIAPIYAAFSVPQARLAEIKGYMSKGPLAVTAAAPGDASPESGTLTFVDNAVDPATGTVLLKATFANAEERLWPGQFVEVVVTLTTLPQAVVAPTAALQTGPQGPFVFVIKQDGTAAVHPVTPGVVFGEETVITEGLEAGEKVVIRGALRLTPGARVVIKSGLDDAGPAKP